MEFFMHPYDVDSTHICKPDIDSSKIWWGEGGGYTGTGWIPRYPPFILIFVHHFSAAANGVLLSISKDFFLPIKKAISDSSCKYGQHKLFLNFKG